MDESYTLEAGAAGCSITAPTVGVGLLAAARATLPCPDPAPPHTRAARPACARVAVTTIYNGTGTRARQVWGAMKALETFSQLVRRRVASLRRDTSDFATHVASRRGSAKPAGRML